MTSPAVTRAAILAALCFAVPAEAAWVDNGDSLCTAANEQSGCAMVSDGAGGALVCWRDRRNSGMGIDLYARGITSTGSLIGGPTGVPICVQTNDESNQAIATDGKGGAIIAWEDSRKTPAGSAIYAQRMRANGTVAWAANGVPVDTMPGYQLKPSLIPDGSSGVIVVWEATRSGRSQIYAQRLDSLGVVKWTANGLPVATTLTEETDPVAVTDGAGGAMISWYDARSTAGGYNSVYAQRINGSGAPPAPWPAAGVSIVDATDFPSLPTMAVNDSGGAVIAWEDYRDFGTNGADIYAQRVDGSGNLRWTLNGAAVCAFSGDQVSPTLTRDGSGGTILAWEDVRGGTTNRTIYGQRMLSGGTKSWATDGVLFCSAPQRRFYPKIIADGVGGGITTWQDYRTGVNTDIYAQRVTGGGALLWGSTGVAVCDTTNDQQLPVLVSDGGAGALIAWHDGRGGSLTSNYDIYVQHLNANGATWSTTAVDFSPVARFAIDSPRPNPASGPVLLAFRMPDAAPVEVAIFDLAGRAVRQLARGERYEAGAHTLHWDGRDESGALTAPGLYFVRARAGALSADARIVRIR